MIPKLYRIQRMHKGYTIVEILLAFSIALILANSGHAMYQRALRESQRIDVQTLMQLLGQARESAMLLKHPVKLCALDAQHTCLSGRQRSVSILTQRGGQAVVLSRYALKHPHAYLVIRASGQLPIFGFSSTGQAPAFGSLYYCMPADKQSTALRIIVNISGHFRQHVSDERTHCDA